MSSPLIRWSEIGLGQLHYVLGYIVTLTNHNWPIMLALALAVWFGVTAYLHPSRCTVSRLLSALLFGLSYEWDKHVAIELHKAIDFLFMLELSFLNAPMHWLMGPIASAALWFSVLAMTTQSIRLSLRQRRA